MEYRSKMELLGLPLVHVRFRGPGDTRMWPPAAKGWIAAGDAAIGVLLAVGGGAVGTVAIGGVSAGILSLGGMALGFMALGGGAVGWWALGGLAIGAEAALGGLAIAGKIALGGLAIAGEAAAGGETHAPQVGEAAVRAYFDGHPFFHWGQLAAKHARWALVLPLVLPIILLWRRLTAGDPPSSA